jgi:isoleucyl-tRNA synthetase
LTEKKKESSIFLTLFPAPKIGTADSSLRERWDQLLQIRDDVSKVLEMARKKKEIGHSLEASVDLFAEGDLLEFLRGYEKEMPALLIVSTVNIFSGSQNDLDASGSTLDRSTTHEKKISQAVPGEVMKGLAVRVKRSIYPKCERCWMYLPSVGTHKKHPTLCSRCYGVLSKGMGRES